MSTQKYQEYNNIFINFFTSMLSIKNTDLDMINSSIKKENSNIQKFNTQNPDDINDLWNALTLIGKDKNENNTENDKIKFFMKNIKKIQNKDGSVEYTTNDAYIKSLFTQLNISGDLMSREEQNHLSLALMNICSTFEIFLTHIIKFELLNIYKNGSFIGKKSLTYNEIMKMSNFDDIKTHLIDEYIIELQRKDKEGWIKDYINICTKVKSTKKLNKEFQQLIKRVANVFNIRNLFVHNAGIINYNYKGNLNINGHQYKIGDQIKLSKDSLVQVTNLFLTLGCKLFLLNIEKNNYLSIDYFKAYLISPLIKNIRREPELCNLFFDKMVKHDINYINKNKIKNEYKLKNYFAVDIVNLWLSFNKTNNSDLFWERYSNDYHLIKNLNGNSKNIELLDLFLFDYSKNYRIRKSIDYIDSLSDKVNKVNALTFPIFDSIRNENQFFEYARKIQYN